MAVATIPPAPPPTVKRHGELNAFFADFSSDALIARLMEIGLEDDYYSHEAKHLAHARGEASFGEILVALHERSTRDVFDAAVPLLTNADPSVRIIGILILRELGTWGERPLFPEHWELFRELVALESDLAVVRALASAYSFMSGSEAVDMMVEFSRHSDYEIRSAVAFSICNCGPMNDPRIVEVQLALAGDDDADVRGSAVYDFMENITLDNQIVRDMLFTALNDEDEKVREYATRALNARGISVEA